jgi:hypothetical protein
MLDLLPYSLVCKRWAREVRYFFYADVVLHKFERYIGFMKSTVASMLGSPGPGSFIHTLNFRQPVGESPEFWMLFTEAVKQMVNIREIHLRYVWYMTIAYGIVLCVHKLKIWQKIKHTSKPLPY